MIVNGSDAGGEGAPVSRPRPLAATLAPVLTAPQSARLNVRIGRLRVRSSLSMTPAGLGAVGVLVSAILLSVPGIIRAARTGIS